jgi:hypothetical protein
MKLGKHKYCVDTIKMYDTPIHIGGMPYKFWEKVKESAKRRQVPIRISPDKMFDIFLQQEGKCFYTRLNLCLIDSQKHTCASIDRINPLVSYCKTNCIWVHPSVNTMKHCFSHEVFLALCKMVSDTDELFGATQAPKMLMRLSKDMEYVSIGKAAELLQVSTQSIRNYCRDKKLNYISTPGGHRRVTTESINRMLKT